MTTTFGFKPKEKKKLSTIDRKNHWLASSIAFFNVFSKIFFESQKPCLVLPNELGPAEVGVSLPMFRILILASAGISSGSSSSSALNTDATVGFGIVVAWLVDFLKKCYKLGLNS